MILARSPVSSSVTRLVRWRWIPRPLLLLGQSLLLELLQCTKVLLRWLVGGWRTVAGQFIGITAGNEQRIVGVVVAPVVVLAFVTIVITALALLTWLRDLS